jgi:two-component system OmpR family response regulator
MTRPQVSLFLLEDDPVLGEGLRTYLQLEGFEVDWQHGYSTALQRIQQRSYDLYLLDITLPQGSGIALCQQLRARAERAPILFITARTDETSVLEGFGSGANDYVRKPFSNRELLARIQASLRWRQPSAQVQLGSLRLDLEARKALWHGQELRMNRRQFDVLRVLMQNPGAVLSRDQMMHLLDFDLHVADRAIDAHISQLRQLLRQQGVTEVAISAVYGLGYRLEPVSDD